MSTTIKAKYKLGQMVWYIANGYVSNARIRAVFLDAYDCVMYSIESANYSDEKYTLRDNKTYNEDCIYPSKKSLIKSIDEQEDDE